MKRIPHADGNRTTDKDLSLLLKEKGRICVTVIVPTHPVLPDRERDRLRLETAIMVAKENLRFTCRNTDLDRLLHDMDHLYGQVDFSDNQEGLGLFVSTGLQLQVRFPFTVTGKVTVGEQFELRDMYCKLSYSLPYYVLYLQEGKARLFDALLLSLKEVKDKNFPVIYTAEDDPDPKGGNGSLRNGYPLLSSTGRNSIKVEKQRYQTFAHKVDGLLGKYVTAQAPFILCGSKNSVAHFVNITSHVDCLAGVVSCNNYFADTELAGKAWLAFRSFLDERKKEQIDEYEEKVGEGLTECGLPSVWQATAEGRGLKLLVEKDFRRAGFIKKNDSSIICLHPPGEPYKTLPDAVDDLIAMAREKNVQVVFVENGELGSRQHIALITRF